MRILWRRTCLRDEKCPHEERMRREFDDPRLAILILAGDLQSMRLQLELVFRIQSEVAVELLCRLSSMKGGGGFTSRFDGNLHAHSDQGTTQGSDEQAGRVGVRLGVGRVRESQYVAGILDRQMLKAAARADKGNAVFPGVSNSGQRSVKTSIGAAGAAQQSLKFTEVVRLIRGEPHGFNRGAQNLGRVLNARVRRNMR